MTAALALSELQTDALRELTNVCGGRGADALSRMIGERPVLLGVPEELQRQDVALLLGGPAADVVAGRVELGGKLRGELWLILREHDAAALSEMLDTSH